jgi:hypothetical protein
MFQTEAQIYGVRHQTAIVVADFAAFRSQTNAGAHERTSWCNHESASIESSLSRAPVTRTAYREDMNAAMQVQCMLLDSEAKLTQYEAHREALFLDVFPWVSPVYGKVIVVACIRCSGPPIWTKPQLREKISRSGFDPPFLFVAC